MKRKIKITINWTKIVGYGMLSVTTPLFSLSCHLMMWKAATNLMIYSFIILLGICLSEDYKK
jgi:hypothetical protein